MIKLRSKFDGLLIIKARQNQVSEDERYSSHDDILNSRVGESKWPFLHTMKASCSMMSSLTWSSFVTGMLFPGCFLNMHYSGFGDD